MPNDVPRYVRCYHTGGSIYVIVFTRMGRTGSNRYSRKGKGYPYLTANQKDNGQWEFDAAEHQSRPIDTTQTFSAFLVDFQDLPAIVRQEVRNMYIKLWRI